MFPVQRFVGPTRVPEAGVTQDGTVADRIARINLRKAAFDQGEASSSKVTLQPPPIATVPPPVAGPVRSIHPSRLAASQALRQEDRKAKIAANGGVKEKTKAKQRYLKTKKDRRKKRKAVESLKGKKQENGQTIQKAASVVTSEAVESADRPATKKQKLEQENSTKDATAAESSSSSSDSESDSDSDSETSSSDSSADVKGDASLTLEEIEESKPAASSDVDETIPPAEDDPAEKPELSRFAAPRRTLQASRKDLAAQGLPPGLANPQRVDPSLTATVKMSDHGDVDHISPHLRHQLSRMGIKEWFAVQTAVIPLLLSQSQSRSLYPDPPLRDLCVSAPTGSGKTLSYSVPIVEVLSDRICRRLRALIILPTRELVNQVRDTMVQLAKGSTLSIAALTGQQSFQQEQALLVDAEDVQEKRKAIGPVPGATPRRNAVDRQKREIDSKVDILIVTPGRLIDHLEHTPGFTLQHLRFLVIDEADRLLSQSFQEWLPRVLDGLRPTTEEVKDTKMERLAPAWLRHRQDIRLRASGDTTIQDVEPVGVQKLLFSATLTRDPARVLALQLRNAEFVSVEDAEEETVDQDDEGVGRHESFIDRQETFALPASLKEHMIVTEGAEKPLDLLYLLHNPHYHLRQVMCFTKSVENASRLVKLVDFFEQVREANKEDRLMVREYSSELNSAQRSRLLRSFREKEVDVLVCSDVMARGIDLPDVRHVISYDVPVDVAKYVHRVGRTARANREGDAWTLVEEQEARHFKAMMKRGGRMTKLEKVKVPSDKREELRNHYLEALTKLEALYTTNSATK